MRMRSGVISSSLSWTRSRARSSSLMARGLKTVRYSRRSARNSLPPPDQYPPQFQPASPLYHLFQAAPYVVVIIDDGDVEVRIQLLQIVRVECGREKLLPAEAGVSGDDGVVVGGHLAHKLLEYATPQPLQRGGGEVEELLSAP